MRVRDALRVRIRTLAMRELPRDLLSRSVATAVAAAAIATTIVGGFGPLVVFVLGLLMIAWFARLAASPAQRSTLVRLLLLGLAGRTLFTTLLHVVLVARGRNGALFQDDAGYVLIATDLARSWRGLPVTEAYLLFNDPSIATGYVILLAGVIWTLGESVLAAKLVNTILGVLQAILVFRTMRVIGLPGAGLGAAAVMVFPSLVLWSALTLKDTFAVTFMLVAIWAAAEFQRTGRWWGWVGTLLALLALRDVRVYAFVILALAWPFGIVIAAKGARKRAATAALLASALMILTSSASAYLDERGLGQLTFLRRAMAQGARSAYVEPLPVLEAPCGHPFKVEVPGRTPDPGRGLQLHEIPLGGQLAIEGEAVPTAPGPVRAVVMVRPGDYVVTVARATQPRTTRLSGFSAEGATKLVESVAATANCPIVAQRPGPTAEVPEEATFELPEAWLSQRPLVADGLAPATAFSVPILPLRLFPEQVNIVAQPDSGDSLEANIQHLPIGALHVLGAPFPLAAQTVTETALIPEMIVWYVALAFAVVGAATILRHHAFGSAYAGMTFGALFLALSLVEGNVGTLVRHRAMLVPFVMILAGVGIVRLLPQLERDLARLLIRIR